MRLIRRPRELATQTRDNHGLNLPNSPRGHSQHGRPSENAHRRAGADGGATASRRRPAVPDAEPPSARRRCGMSFSSIPEWLRSLFTFPHHQLIT